ncbi:MULTISPECIES: FecR family protein [unclassified Sphingobacterium]|uniref:FecR family protein n=1 Tax=unclassified Sphingobacterium TaxID=2609468 RepID=UPI002601091A|nr:MULTISPECIES: FecR family protein [unclassified Sphingobacterium]
MKKEEFQQLTEKISNGTASQREIARYLYYYAQIQQNMDNEDDTGWDTSATAELLHARIAENMPSKKIIIRKLFVRISAVAAILLAVSIFYVWHTLEAPQPAKITALKPEVNNYDIEPGGNKAILTLSDGTSLNLDDSQQGILALQGSSTINKTADGRLSYATKSNSKKNASHALYNRISIPEGGQYQLTLPDGTKVWLNAGSSLRFPVAFDQLQREVELTGEAYFEVASLYAPGNKMKRPFVVKTPTQKIEVLGTHFNVGAYDDEKLVKTTLLEGAVIVSALKTGIKKSLKPGQQALLGISGQIQLRDHIDTEEAVAWKKGMFYFSNTDLSIILRQLARWYNVEIDMENIPNKKFNGELSRNVKLSQVLQMMEKTSGIKFKIEGRRLYMVN